MGIAIKRIYEAAEANDGKRILVDGLWPRGVSKDKARLDEWLKEIAPSPRLRAWFGHEGERFAAFGYQYRAELDAEPLKQEAVRHLLEMSRKGRITLLYGAKNAKVNHAVILRQYLQEKL